MDHIQRMFDELFVGDLGNMHQSVLVNTDIHKRAEINDAGQLVSSGTFLLPPHLTKGVWTAKFDHGFGDVTVNVND